MASHKGARLHHSSTQAVPLDRGRRHGRAVGQKPRWPWLWIALAVFVLVGGALAVVLSGAGRASGRLTAAQQMYDFGQVPIHGGLITTRFPLTVEGEALVTELSSS